MFSGEIVFSVSTIAFPPVHFGDASAFSMPLVLVSVLNVSCTFMAARVQDRLQENHQQIPRHRLFDIDRPWEEFLFTTKTTKTTNKQKKEK